MGLARFSTKEAEDTMKKLCGTYSYLAPEVFGGNSFTEKADVFAMGIVFWEIATTVCNGIPSSGVSHVTIAGVYQNPYLEEFKNLSADFQIAVRVAEHNLRNTIPASCPPQFAELIEQCWSANPDDRPTTSVILQKLLGMRDSIRVITIPQTTTNSL
jgi:serine/threonine protein kinase